MAFFHDSTQFRSFSIKAEHFIAQLLYDDGYLWLEIGFWDKKIVILFLGKIKQPSHVHASDFYIWINVNSGGSAQAWFPFYRVSHGWRHVLNQSVHWSITLSATFVKMRGEEGSFYLINSIPQQQSFWMLCDESLILTALQISIAAIKPQYTIMGWTATESAASCKLLDRPSLCGF